MITVGIVGMGVIGTHIAEAITKGIPGIALAGVTVRDPAKARGHRALALEWLIRESDLIVEAATQAALREFGPAVLSAGKHLMVLSVGGLVGVLDEWARSYASLTAGTGSIPRSGSRLAPNRKYRAGRAKRLSRVEVTKPPRIMIAVGRAIS